MDDFTTVFIFSENANQLLSGFEERLSIGMAFFIIGLIGLAIVLIIFAKFFKNSNSKQVITFIKWFLVLSFSCSILWAIPWIGLHSFSYFHYKNEYARLQAIYDSHQYQIAEGVVHVLQTQPASGHDEGDILVIGDVQLDVDAYLMTFGYKTTIAQGGALTEGTYARIFYDYNPNANKYSQYTILQVDVKK